MLLRFIAENIYSFKGAAEFNTFPSSKSHSHEQHKYPVLTQRPSGLVQSMAPMALVKVTFSLPSNS